MSDYITSDELRDYITSGTNVNQALADAVCTVVSEEINDYCGRHFWAETTATARTYRPCNWWLTEVDDISDTATATVAVSTNFDFTYDQTWTVNTDFIFEPVNPSPTGLLDPWTQIRATGATQRFMSPLGFWGILNPYPVQVTAKWGWPAVPSRVTAAARIGAAHLFKLREAPDGFVGLDGWGPRQIREAPMFKELLAPYCKDLVAVG